LRPLHLLGLMPPEYRFYSPDGAPLILPGTIPGSDHEVLLAFLQQVITAQPLPRVEVDWHTMLLEPSRRYLEHLLGERGSSGVLLVVKVREPGIDLREVVAHPAIHAFEHVAISNVHPGGRNEDLRALLTLTKDVRDRAEERYDELADRIESLRPEEWRLITDFVMTLQNPIDVLETVNALIEVQLEGNPPGEQRSQVLQRALIRLLEWRPAGEICALIGLATRGVEETADLLTEPDAALLLEGLRVQGLFRDGRLRQWAAFLKQGELREKIFGRDVFGRDARLPTEAHRTEAWAQRVQTALSWVGAGRTIDAFNAPLAEDAAIMRELNSVAQSLNEGKLSLARESMMSLERGKKLRLLQPEFRVIYCAYRARLERQEGSLELSDSGFAFQVASRTGRRVARSSLLTRSRPWLTSARSR